MKSMNSSYGISRGQVPHGACEASMMSRFPVAEGGNPDTLVNATWNGSVLVFSPAIVAGEKVTLDSWESHATAQGKAFAQKIRTGWKPSFNE